MNEEGLSCLISQSPAGGFPGSRSPALWPHPFLPATSTSQWLSYALSLAGARLSVPITHTRPPAALLVTHLFPAACGPVSLSPPEGHLNFLGSGRILFFFSSFTFLLGTIGEGASSLSLEVLTVSSAIPNLGPEGSWAHWACSHHLRRALGSCRV